MKLLLRISILLALATQLACCNDKPAPEPEPETRNAKTIIAYFYGTSLSYYFSTNLQMMEKAVTEGALGNNSRLILYHQKSTNIAEVREIRYDAESGKAVVDVIDTFSLEEPLNASSYGENMKMLMDYAPADDYSVIFLGHSTAWLPKNTDSPVLRAYGMQSEFVPSFEKMPGAAITRHIGERNVNLDIEELAEGLASTGVKFNCLYFDVCFMASLEAVYELRNIADYVIASPCEIMGAGSPYDTILKPLFNDDYERVCNEYFAFYNNYFYPSGCLSVIDCSKLEAVADVVKRMNATAAADGFDIFNVQPYEGRTSPGNSPGHWFYDAEDYYNQICSNKALVDEFSARLTEAVPYRNHTDQFYSAYNDRFNEINHFSGISLTPDEKCIEAIKDSDHRRMLVFYNPYLRQTAWYKATH